jgi:hypothetical protein
MGPFDIQPRSHPRHHGSLLNSRCQIAGHLRFESREWKNGQGQSPRPSCGATRHHQEFVSNVTLLQVWRSISAGIWNMQYVAVGFDPPVSRDGTSAAAASALENLIAQHTAEGWEFVGVQNHSTIVPGSSGCFGFGATNPYPQTISIVVFRQ